MKNRNYGLDLMRAAAITLVLVSHFTRGTWILGVLGVELFFVLSGFLIGGIFLREIYTTSDFGFPSLYLFLRRRWYRTLPNYYLFLLISCAIWPIVGQSTPHDIWKYLIFFQNLAWPLSGFFHTWSLAVEEWFYLIFPVTAVAILMVTKSRIAAIAASVTVMTLCPILLRFLLWPSTGWTDELHMIVIYRLDALMYGVLMAWVNLRRPRTFHAIRPLSAVGVVLGAIALLFGHDLDSVGRISAIPAAVFTFLPIACAFLLPLACDIKPTRTALDRVVHSMSLWSYSIYLAHPVVLFLGNHLVSPFVHPIAGKLAVKLACFAITIGVSKLTFDYFETPMMKLRDSTRPLTFSKESRELIVSDR